MTRFFLTAVALQLVMQSAGQGYALFWTDNTTAGKKRIEKVYVQQALLDYGGVTPLLTWTGTADRQQFATGEGILRIQWEKREGLRLMLIYKGSLLAGKMQGQGELSVYLTMDTLLYDFLGLPYYTYKGGFRNGEFNGYGDFISAVPSRAAGSESVQGISAYHADRLNHRVWKQDLYFYEFKGSFSNGKIADTENGTGKTYRMFWMNSGMEYTGPVRNGMPNGRGSAHEVTRVILPVHLTYYSVTGNFTNGVLQGRGRQTGRNFEYEGEFRNGVREGRGKMSFFGYHGFLDVYKDKSLQEGRYLSAVLEGDFFNGTASGPCTIHFYHSAAFKYTGQVKQGLLEGTGEIEFLDGSRLRGRFSNGILAGEGVMFFANGDRFSGIFNNSKPVKGTVYYVSGGSYEGEMSVREGKDKITGKPVQLYIRQGRGFITRNDGTRFEVSCADDNCTPVY